MEALLDFGSAVFRKRLRVQIQDSGALGSLGLRGCRGFGVEVQGLGLRVFQVV